MLDRRARESQGVAIELAAANDLGTGRGGEGEQHRGQRQELVERMLPFVRHVARRYANRGEPLEDLVQVGCIGLLKAIDRFDPDRGTEFTTFALPTIVDAINKGEIFRFVAKPWLREELVATVRNGIPVVLPDERGHPLLPSIVHYGERGVEVGYTAAAKQAAEEALKNAKGELVATETNPAKLTSQGRAILKKYGNNFKTGSVGGWIDVLKDDRTYDALIIFSDFQDGVRLYESKKGEPKMVYSDSSYHKVGGVQKGHTRWQREWLEAFGKAPQGAGPRLYLFTVQQEPQAFLQACVAASGGSATSVSWLRKGGRKAP